MSDFYTEQLIKKKTSTKDILMKVLLIAAAILSVLIIFVFPLGLLIPVIVIAVVVFLFRRLDVEYEYLYVNGDFDVDKIMHKSKRKNVFSMNVSEMELLAPAGHPQLNQFRNARVCDFSSGTASENLYVLVVAANGQQTKVVFEPNASIIEGFYMLAPRKVIQK